jgi:hypothetical protein
MTLMEQIKKQLDVLPPEKQSEVLDFILFLQQRVRAEPLSSEEGRTQRIRTALNTLAELNGAHPLIL